eukprot:NODE_85_length_22232_cov_1.318619.p16 type:complete len:180 gc:universal NODE_85_length_22232_cov_1.318619:1450-1989(+)
MMSSKKGGASKGQRLAAGLKSGLGVLLVLTVLYGIYQLCVGMYVTGSFWLIAGLLGMISLVGSSSKVVLAGLALYSIFMIAAFITHIVRLATFNDYFNNNYPERANDNAGVKSMGESQTRDTWYGSEIAGLIASFLGLATVIPLLWRLKRHHDTRHTGRTRGNMEGGYTNAGQYAPNTR